MGGNGAASGIRTDGKSYGKKYGSEYYTVLKFGNIKFVKTKDDTLATTAPMETRTKNRVYVTISNKSNMPKFISYYDKENKRYKQIDLEGNAHTVKTSSGKIKKLEPPHIHLGYLHDENGSRRINNKESKMIDNIKDIWYNYINK